MLELRPDQISVKQKLYREIRNGNNKVVVKGMTAFGKTVLAASIIRDALSSGTDVLFTVPMITLVEQTIVEFSQCGITDIGVIQANHFLTDFSKPVQICSIQTIASLIKKDPLGWERYQKGKLVIHDECHIHYEAHERMITIADKPVIGLSATPWRRGLGKHYDTLVNGPDTKWLIENGFLSTYKAFSHYIPDLKGVSDSRDGDYSLSDTGKKYEPKVIGDIVNNWKELAEGRKTILFAPRVADAERFALEFRRAGISAVAVSGYLDQDECAKEVEKFRIGETTVLCSVSKLAMGFSVKDVGCIIDAQPTKSLMRHVQKLGRGLRTHPDKKNLIIIDNAGNLLRNGLPDDDYPTELDDGESGTNNDRRKADEPLPKTCPKCSTVKPPKTPKCPSCGFEAVTQSILEVEAGELAEITHATNQRRANRDTDWSDKTEFAAQLKGYAKQKKYKPGWFAHQYKKKFGVWPNDERVKHVAPKQPSELIFGWIKHQAIKKNRGRAA